MPVRSYSCGSRSSVEDPPLPQGRVREGRASGDWQTCGSQCSGTWWILIMPGSHCHPLSRQHGSRELCFPGHESPLLSLLVPSFRQLCLLLALALASKLKLLVPGWRVGCTITWSLCGFKIWGAFLFRILQQPQRWWQGGDYVSVFKHADSAAGPGKEWKLYW